MTKRIDIQAFKLDFLEEEAWNNRTQRPVEEIVEDSHDGILLHKLFLEIFSKINIKKQEVLKRFFENQRSLSSPEKRTAQYTFEQILRKIKLSLTPNERKEQLKNAKFPIDNAKKEKELKLSEVVMSAEISKEDKRLLSREEVLNILEILLTDGTINQKQKTAFEMYDLVDIPYKYTDIAQEIGCSWVTVRYYRIKVTLAIQKHLRSKFKIVDRQTGLDQKNDPRYSLLPGPGDYDYYLAEKNRPQEILPETEGSTSLWQRFIDHIRDTLLGEN